MPDLQSPDPRAAIEAGLRRWIPRLHIAVLVGILVTLAALRTFLGPSSDPRSAWTLGIASTVTVLFFQAARMARAALREIVAEREEREERQRH